MNTDIQNDLTDLEAVMKHLQDKTPLDPEVARRIREKSHLLTEDTCRRLGEIDVDALIPAARE
jgi:hypothetical protein